MAGDWLGSIDWRRPWLAPLRAQGQAIASAGDWRRALNEAAAAIGLRNHRGLPIRFVPQESLPAGVAYEAFISDTGQVPTRENLHDFFNALVWLSYPRIKLRLNALQAAEIERRAALPASARGKLRDAATIFDENAALLVVSDPSLAAALREHSWREVFIDRRSDFVACCEVRLFGHALMEKLVQAYKAITAHAWIVMAERPVLSLSETGMRLWIDESVSERLQAGLDTRDFTPLPVLGVPGWWEGQDAGFYADEKVFRPKRLVAR
jgi:hypothetical protein